MNDLYEINVSVLDDAESDWTDVRHSTITIESCIWDAVQAPERFGHPDPDEVRAAWAYTSGVIARASAHMAVDVLAYLHQHGCVGNEYAVRQCGLQGVAYLLAPPEREHGWKAANPRAGVAAPLSTRAELLTYAAGVLERIAESDAQT